MGWIYELIYGKKDKKIFDLEIKLKEAEEEILNLKKQLPVKIPTPQTYGKITWREQLEILKPLNAVVNITDEYLNTTSKQEAQAYSEMCKTQFRQWKENEFDCDNFSASLYGYWMEPMISFAFGLARSSNHQFNIMIDNEKKIWIVEPQSNKWMTIEEAKKTKTPDKLSYFPITLIWM